MRGSQCVAPEGISYSEMNDIVDSVPIGSDGVSIIPFGNGAGVYWRIVR